MILQWPIFHYRVVKRPSCSPDILEADFFYMANGQVVWDMSQEHSWLKIVNLAVYQSHPKWLAATCNDLSAWSNARAQRSPEKCKFQILMVTANSSLSYECRYITVNKYSTSSFISYFISKTIICFCHFCQQNEKFLNITARTTQLPPCFEVLTSFTAHVSGLMHFSNEWTKPSSISPLCN